MSVELDRTEVGHEHRQQRLSLRRRVTPQCELQSGRYVSDIPQCHSSDPEGSFPQCSLLDRRIDAVRELAFGFLVTRPRLVERNVGIDS